MTPEDPAAFSESYRVLARNLPAGWSLSSALVEPEITLKKTGAGYVASLGGYRFSRGKKQTWSALSTKNNWVRDGRIIRPLPTDTPAVFSRLLSSLDPERLSFTDVIRLLKLERPEIPIIAENDVLLPAREATHKICPNKGIVGLQAELFSYQALGVEWMLRTIQHTGGLILADEMGLGKTVQIIALLLTEKPSTLEPALVICPTSLIANWKNEILKFGPELSVLIHRGPLRTGVTSGLQRSQIVLSTYDTVVNDLSVFQGVNWSWLICDEAQALKNPDSARRIAISSLPRKRAIPMTGTPVETSLVNLWSLVDLAIPGLLGSRDEFESDYPDCEDSAKAITRFTDPVILRRTVREVAGDLPERFDIDVPLELGDQLSQRYQEILEETIEKYPVAGNLVATGQLQLFCAHPWLQGTGNADEMDDAQICVPNNRSILTPKVERSIAILNEAFRNGRKVLVFAIFNRCREIIQQASSGLMPSGFWGAINGSTPQQERQAIVDSFSNHDGPGCLVLNPKAAGSGLNITAATVVIHFTQAWNPALEAQASARAHRRGQTEPVYIYRLFYEDTVERVMIDRSEWRRQLGNEAVPVSARDAEDLRRALTIKPGVTL